MNKKIKLFICVVTLSSFSTHYGMFKIKRQHNTPTTVASTSLTTTSFINPTDDKDILKYMIIDPNTINNIYRHGETQLIWAARNNKSLVVSALLSQPQLDINKQDINGKTALHYIAEHKNESIIEELLRDPRTDASLTDKNQKTSRDVILGNTEQDAKLRRIIFARIMLDWTVNKQCKKIQDTYWSDTTPINKNIDCQKIIKDTITKIINNILRDQKKQDHYQALPDSAKLPTYATKEFIQTMLLLRLNNFS